MPVSTPSPARICFGRFELDLTSGELHHGDRKVPLPPKSFEILRALSERPGEVVTRDELRTKLWSMNTYVEFDDGLNHAVQKLRQVLGDSAEHPQYIETLPRYGYRFVLPVDSAHGARSTKGKTRIRVVVIAAVLVVVAAALAALNVPTWRDRLLGERTEPPIRSLAVLPLSNLSGDPAQDYFADGMTDALITDLAKLHDVKVISRTSVMQFKDVKKPLPEVARALGVDGILEGSVQRSGARVRITVQLIRGPGDTHLWAESYERDAHDVLTLQGEIAQAVAREIKVALTPEESRHLTRARPVNPQSYELYLKGQYHYYKWNPADFKKAVDYFQKAIDADSQWAPPYAALANTYGWLWIDGAVPPQEALPRFSAALKTALEIDPTLPEVHYTQAAAAFYYRWDWDEADREFRQALALDPSLVEARFEYAWFLSTMGRLPEAIAEAQRAVERDPLSVSANLALGDVYSVARQYEKAIAQLQRTAAIEPNDPRPYAFLCGVYEQKGMFEDAIREYGKAMKLWEAKPEELAGLERAYKQSGASGYWKWKLAQAKRQQEPYEIAAVYSQLDDARQATAWLEKAYEGHAWQMVQLKSFPRWDPVRSNPQFQNLLRRLNFPQS